MLEITTESTSQIKINPLFRFCSLVFVVLTFLFVFKFYTDSPDFMLIALSGMSCSMVLITNFTAKIVAENNFQRALAGQSKYHRKY